MTARKSERLLNLLITLLVARSYVSKDRIREVIEDYRRPSDDAFEKMFERDKEELRSLGIPIEVGYVDRALRGRAGLPDRARRLRAARHRPRARGGRRDRARGPGLAARRPRRRHLGRAGQAQGRRVQRRPRGARRRAAADGRRRAGVRAVLGGHPDAHPGHLRLPAPAAPGPPPRHLQPWGVVSYRGRWYVVGPRHRPRRARGCSGCRASPATGRTRGPAGAFVVPMAPTCAR